MSIPSQILEGVHISHHAVAGQVNSSAILVIQVNFVGTKETPEEKLHSAIISKLYGPVKQALNEARLRFTSDPAHAITMYKEIEDSLSNYLK